ncbi:MAG: four helix bundle protein [Candidatus Moranbacteria bacterium]|nr:four helix bundle protein [Candidatus Moranbacteria bacterium]
MVEENRSYSKISKFTDLIAWQEGHKLVLMVYKMTDGFPRDEKYNLIDQMRRSSVSVTSNIAEGFAKVSSKDKNRFYNIAQTSLIELQNQLIICKDLKYLSNADFEKLANQSINCHKLINALIRSTRLNKYKN